MNLFKIFVTGGLFCLFGEVLWAKTKLGVVRTLILCIVAGVILDMTGLLGPIIGFGQEGFMVTILGAGASMYDGILGSIQDHGMIGVLCPVNFYFLRYAALIFCTLTMSIILGLWGSRKK